MSIELYFRVDTQLQPKLMFPQALSFAVDIESLLVLEVAKHCTSAGLFRAVISREQNGSHVKLEKLGQLGDIAFLVHAKLHKDQSVNVSQILYDGPETSTLPDIEYILAASVAKQLKKSPTDDWTWVFLTIPWN